MNMKSNCQRPRSKKNKLDERTIVEIAKIKRETKAKENQKSWERI